MRHRLLVWFSGTSVQKVELILDCSHIAAANQANQHALLLETTTFIDDTSTNTILQVSPSGWNAFVLEGTRPTSSTTASRPPPVRPPPVQPPPVRPPPVDHPQFDHRQSITASSNTPSSTTASRPPPVRLPTVRPPPPHIFNFLVITRLRQGNVVLHLWFPVLGWLRAVKTGGWANTLQHVCSLGSVLSVDDSHTQRVFIWSHRLWYWFY